MPALDRLEQHKTKGADVRLLVAHWLPELKILDALTPNPSIMPTPVMTAALLSLRHYRVADFVDDSGDRQRIIIRRATGNAHAGEPTRRKVLDFWERYIRNEGTKNAATMDAVEALRILRTLELRAPGKHRTKASYWYLIAQALSCVERWLDNKMSTTTEGGSVRIGPIREISEYFPRTAPPEKPPRLELRKTGDDAKRRV